MSVAPVEPEGVRLGVRLTLGVVLLTLTLRGAGGANEQYTGARVFSVRVPSSADWGKLEGVLDHYGNQVEEWARFDDVMHVMMKRPVIEEVTSQLTSQGFTVEELIHDIKSLIDSETTRPSVNTISFTRGRHRRSESVSNDVVGRYATGPEIAAWLQQLARFFPDVVELREVGRSEEGRPIHLIKISTPGGTKVGGMWVDGGFHPREWISQSTAIFLIYKLLVVYQQGGPEMRALLEPLEWYIVPNANPDGYIYSHTHDRLWRKNRSNQTPPGSNKTCIGVDLNRNWGFHWAELHGSQGTSSQDPCSVVYHGPRANSEPETQALQAALLREGSWVRAYISLHSYTQALFTRWAYTDWPVQDHSLLKEVAGQAAEAMSAVHQTDYVYGIAKEHLYQYSGGSADWVKGVAGIKYSYTIELRDKGKFGFVLPANYVIPVGEETFAGIQTIARHVATEFQQVLTPPPTDRSNVYVVGNNGTVHQHISVLYLLGVFLIIALVNR